MCVYKTQASIEAWNILKEDHFLSLPVQEKNLEVTKTKTVSVLNLFHYTAFCLDTVTEERPSLDDLLAGITAGHLAGTWCHLLYYSWL